MKLFIQAILIAICTNILAKKSHKPKKHTTESPDNKIALAANAVYPQYEYPQYVFLTLKDLKTINDNVAKYHRWEECFLSPGSMKGCIGDPEGVAKMIIDKVIESRKTIPKQQKEALNALEKKKHQKKKKKHHDNNSRTNEDVPEEKIITAKDIYPQLDLPESLKLSLSNIRDINIALTDFNRNTSCILGTVGSMVACKGDFIEVSKKIIEKIASSSLRQSV